MKTKYLASTSLSLLLTLTNILLGTLVAILMMAGDFLNSLAEAHGQASLTKFDLFFLEYVLHPGTGIVYIFLFIGLSIYQNNIPRITCRILAHLVMLLLSTSILLQSVVLLKTQY